MSIRHSAKFYPHRSNIRLTEAAISPITLKELRTHVRIPVGELEEDQYLTNLINMAVRWLEDFANLSLIRKTYRTSFDSWPGDGDNYYSRRLDQSSDYYYGDQDEIRDSDIILPVYPLVSVEALRVFNEDDLATSISVSDVFDVDTLKTPGRLTLKRGLVYPDLGRANKAVEIDYTAGYSTTAVDIPPTLKRAILEMAGFMWMNRGDCSMEESFSKSGAQNLIRMYRVRRI